MAALPTWLKSRWLLTLLAVVLLCVLLWIAGPYFAFAEHRPLATTTGRLAAILIVFAIWALAWQWRQWRAARAAGRFAEAAGGGTADGRAVSDGAGTAAAGAPARTGAASGADRQLGAQFAEALAAMRSSKQGARSLLELPWYVIIGPPGAGKTTALANSGLDFPLADRFGNAAVRGVGGTRSCDWWFTSEAILLDTAGRYTTQDSDERADSAGWLEFLGLLKKHRRRRPLNGVLLALSIADLAAFTDAERERHVGAIRRRLAELNERLGVALPVYVLITKADLIAGFDEYFDDLDLAGRSQVWGATFPWEQSREGSACERVGAELDALVARLAARVPDRLQAERDAGRRRAIFAFPQQVASFKGAIAKLTREIFASAALDGRMWLRGVYFTSGTQEGTPLDRMMGTLARTFGLGLETGGGREGQGKAFFVRELLRGVVFGEAGLAGSDPRADRRSALAATALCAAIAAVTLALAAALFTSYRANERYVARVAAAMRPLAGLRAPGGEASLADTLPPLDALEGVVGAAGRNGSSVPWHMRFGLYQGARLSADAEDAYFRALNRTLAPAAARDFAARIEASQSTPDRLYEYLKAYLMLGQPAHLDPRQMRIIADAEWTRVFPDDPRTAAGIASHFDRLIADPARVQPVPLDASLVAQAQASLEQASLPLIMYARVRLAYADDTAQALRLDTLLGLGASSILYRRSGKPLSAPFPALYTRAVFDEFNRTGKLELVKQFHDDAWMFGSHAPSIAQSPRLAAQVEQLYEQDYIKAWDGLLGDIAVRTPRDTQDAIAILTTLSSPTSPLERLLALTAANTDLLKPAATASGGQAAGGAAAKLAGLEGRIGAVLGGGSASGPKPGTAVTQHFAALDALVAGAPGSRPIDQLRALMAQARDRLQAASGLGGEPASPSVLAAIQNAVGAVKSAVAGMPPVMEGLVGGVVERSKSVALGVAHTDLTSRYQTEVVSPCRQLIGHAYPFVRSSATDVTLEDFARVFGAGGYYDAFFRSSLASLVDTSGAAWQWRQGARAIGGSQTMLAKFEAARRIREVFFAPGGSKPEVRFNVTPDELDPGVDRFRLEIDGQQLEYHHGPPRTVSMTWPGAAAGQAAAIFDLHAGAHPRLAFQGPWALFRLLDHAQVRPLSQTRFEVTFRVGGEQASVVLEAASVLNPFARADLTRFRCE